MIELWLEDVPAMFEDTRGLSIGYGSNNSQL